MTSNGILGLLRPAGIPLLTMERRCDPNAAFLLRELNVTWRGSFISLKISRPKIFCNQGEKMLAWLDWFYYCLTEETKKNWRQGCKDDLWVRPSCLACRAQSVMSTHETDWSFLASETLLLWVASSISICPIRSDVCLARHLATFLEVLIMPVPVQTSHVRAGGISQHPNSSCMVLLPSLA